MTAFIQTLSARVIGGELLSRVARARLTGRLTWESEGQRRVIIFSLGRPEQLDERDHQTQVKEQVMAAVRALAIGTSGKVSFDPVAAATAGTLGIDTLGETLVAVTLAMRPQDFAAIWQARAHGVVEATPLFDTLAAAAGRLVSATLPRLAAPTQLGDLARTPGERAAWLALLVLGGLVATTAPPLAKPAPAVEPLPLPDDPAARQLVEEINRAYGVLGSLSFYDVLGCDLKASPEDIRKAYFEVAKRWHSDRFRSTAVGDDAVRRAEEIFRYAGEAQKALTDPEQRKSYDFVQDRKAKGLPTDVAVILEAEGAFRKAQTLVRRGQAAAAEPILRKVVEMNPGEAEFWAFLGFAVYSARGKAGLDEARKTLSKAIAMSPKMDAPHEFLGKIARIEGQIAEAQRHFRRALEINPKNVDAERELRLIAMRDSKGKDRSKGIGALLGGLFKK